MTQTLPQQPTTMDDWIVRVEIESGEVYVKGVSPHTTQQEAVTSSLRLLRPEHRDNVLKIFVRRRNETESVQVDRNGN